MPSRTLNGGISTELAAPDVAVPNLDTGFLKLLAGAREALRRAGAMPRARAPGPLLGVSAGAGHGGSFRLLATGAGRGSWMARSGGREGVALDPPGGAFSFPSVGAAEEPTGASTPSLFITIKRARERCGVPEVAGGGG